MISFSLAASADRDGQGVSQEGFQSGRGVSGELYVFQACAFRTNGAEYDDEYCMYPLLLRVEIVDCNLIIPGG